MWEGAKRSEGGMVKERVDEATGVRRPTFKRPYNPTMLGTNHLYHSISMMMVGVALCCHGNILVLLLLLLFQ